MRDFAFTWFGKRAYHTVTNCKSVKGVVVADKMREIASWQLGIVQAHKMEPVYLCAWKLLNGHRRVLDRNARVGILTYRYRVGFHSSTGGLCVGLQLYRARKGVQKSNVRNILGQQRLASDLVNGTVLILVVEEPKWKRRVRVAMVLLQLEIKTHSD